MNVLALLCVSGYANLRQTISQSAKDIDHKFSDAVENIDHAVLGSEKGMDQELLEGFKEGFPLPSKVGPVDIDAYMGRWYQTHTSLLPLKTFEKDGECIIADYTKNEPKLPDLEKATFNLINSQTKDGELDQVTGYSSNKLFPFQKPVDGLWYIKIKAEKGKNMYGFYVIQALGPVVDGKYSWSMVSDLTRTSLYVLSRDPTLKPEYGSDVLMKADKLGFNQFYNKPIETPQSPDCAYPPEPIV